MIHDDVYSKAAVYTVFSYATRLLRALDELERPDYPDSLKEQSALDVVHCRDMLSNALSLSSVVEFMKRMDDTEAVDEH